MIEVEHLWKLYGDVVAVKDLSFTVQPGEIVGFLGPNGAGKTTTMRILTCFMPASKGRVRVAGFDVAEDSMEVRKRIGYLPEVPPLYLDMSVVEYLEFVGKIKGLSGAKLREGLDRVVSSCGLEEMKSRLIRKLSKGYRQRTGLAQALIHDPPILILDEPTIGLDPKQIAEIRALIKGLAGSHTVILSTHILPEVKLTCQRAIIIARGEIVVDDTVANLTREGDLERQFLKIVGGAEVKGETREDPAGTSSGGGEAEASPAGGKELAP
jgi:ABC-2 type transport system ATP-binding protein